MKLSPEWELYFVAFFHNTAFTAILTLIPFLNISLNLSGYQYAITFSGYFLTQLIGRVFLPSCILAAFIYGVVSHAVKKRYLFLFCLFGLAVCRGALLGSSLVNFLFAISRTSGKFIWFRIFAGCFDYCSPLYQAYFLSIDRSYFRYLSDLTSVGERLAVTSNLEFLSGLSYLLGPFISGALSIHNLWWGV